jgi:hypothetical protein
VCTLAVKKKTGRFRHVGSDHSLVSLEEAMELSQDRLLLDLTCEAKSIGSVNFNVWTKLHKNCNVLEIGLHSETGCINTILVAYLSSSSRYSCSYPEHT